METKGLISSEKAPQGVILEEIDTKVLQRNANGILEVLSKNTYQNFPPAKLIAVTKTVSPVVVEKLKPLQILDIGENRVQTAKAKMTEISPEFRLHWIGRLQSNKVKDIIESVCMLHSLDRLVLAQEVNRRAGMCQRILPVLVQVNIAGETQKAGLDITEIRHFLDVLKSFSCLKVKGLMAMMPFAAEEQSLSNWFRQTRVLFEQLQAEAIQGIDMEELSMGMSNDYAIAAREGATMVRVGTALFRS